MEGLAGRYLDYVRTVRRYSPRTVEIYADVLTRFCKESEATDDDKLIQSLNPQILRTYEVCLLDTCGLSPRTVGQHMSVLSGFCRYLVREGRLSSNPVRLVARPKAPKRLPEFFREDAMRSYFDGTDFYSSPEAFSAASPAMYDSILSRLVVSVLYCTGMRRAELISLDVQSFDRQLRVLHVRGKGDKMREIPLVESLFHEIVLYLELLDKMGLTQSGPDRPLLVTKTGRRLYPEYVGRVVKRELSSEGDITGRKSPHTLRHTLATELLDAGTDLNSIKELLGHSSLAATQVYTHNSIEKLRNVYNQAHPRAAKTGGNNGNQNQNP